MPSFRGASQVATASVTSFTCAKPTGATAVAAGDIMVAVHATMESQGPLTSMGTPTGGSTWLLLGERFREGQVDDGGTRVWWKVAGASEPSTYGFTQSTGCQGCVSIVAVQDCLPTTPLITLSGYTSTTTTCATPTTTPSNDNAFEIRCVASHLPTSTISWTPPAGFTERTDISVTSGFRPTTTIATRELANGAATGVHNFTASSNLSNWHGITINIAGSPRFIWGVPIGL